MKYFPNILGHFNRTNLLYSLFLMDLYLFSIFPLSFSYFFFQFSSR